MNEVTRIPPAIDSADRRTQLAADRNVFAAERTYAAWVRTGLAALASGIGAKSLLAGIIPELAIRGSATLLILFSAFCFIAGVWRQLWPGPPPPQPDARSIPAAVLILVNGILVLIALAAMVSVWTAQSGAASVPVSSPGTEALFPSR